MATDEMVSEYAEVCKTLQSKLESARRRVERLRCLAEYVLQVHEIQWSTRGKGIGTEATALWDAMSETVVKLLEPILLEVSKAVTRERTFFPASTDDDDFYNKISNRCNKCIEDVSNAGGVMERVDAARECISDLRDIMWEEIERRGKGGKN